MNTILNEMKNKKLNKSKKNVRNYENYFPKIHSFRYNQACLEEQNKDISIEEVEEEQIYIKNSKLSRIQNSIDANKLKIPPLKKKSHKGLSRLFLNDISNIKKNDMKEIKNNDENQNSRFVLNGRLKSIFQTEKQLKSNNLLTDRILHNKIVLDKINNDMAQEIYNIKKHKLNNKIEEEN